MASKTLLNSILEANASKWAEIISERTADMMKQETADKFSLDKADSNALKRLHFIQTLFAEYTQDEYKQNVRPIQKPIDDLFEMRPLGKCTKIDDKSIIYALSSEGDSNLNCNLNLISGKWYYEIDLLVDPKEYSGLHLGFANNEHDNNCIVGFDENSYGYGGVASYGKLQWKPGDTVGIKIDLQGNNSTIEYYLNGISQGIAFENIEHSKGLFAGFTLSKGEHIIFINEETKFSQTMPDGCSPIGVDNDLDMLDIWSVDGQMDIRNNPDGIIMSAISVFPTAVLTKSKLNDGNKYYYEVKLETGGVIQLGVANGIFEANEAVGLGVGDDLNSWSIDLYRMKKWNGSINCERGWEKGDIIGCLLDIDNKTISYSINGNDTGYIISDINVENGLHPSISVCNPVGTRLLLAYLHQIDNMDTETDEQKIAPPHKITYLNVIFGENGCKYKPLSKGVIVKTIGVVVDICNALQNYSYDQYKEDYYYIYPTIGHDGKQPQCICGVPLQKVKSTHCFNLELETEQHGVIRALMCNGCEELVANPRVNIWHCLNTDKKAIIHSEAGYNLCPQCGAEEIAKAKPTLDPDSYKANEDDTYMDCLLNYLSSNPMISDDFIKNIQIFMATNDYDSDCIEYDAKNDMKEDSNIYQWMKTQNKNWFNIVREFVAPSQKESPGWEIELGSKSSKFHFINFDCFGWKCLKRLRYRLEYHSGGAYALSVHFFPMQPDCCKPEDIEANRQIIRERLGKEDVMGGLLLCETIKIDGIDCLEQLIRFPIRPHGTNINWAIIIPFIDRSYVIKCTVMFNDMDLRELQSPFKPEDSNLHNRCYEDPYDPTYKGGVPMFETEKPKYDMQFFWHPLSQLRMKIIPKLKASIHFDDVVHKLTPM